MPNAADLFDRYHLGLFRFFRRMTGDPDVAEDLTQETFLDVVGGLPNYRPMNRDSAWVYCIAQNVLRKHFRQHHPEHVGEEAANGLATESAQILAIGLEEALRLLPVAEREVVVLRDEVGLSYAEIAEATGATLESVRARLGRARKRLRNLLGGRSGMTATSFLKDLS